jgi:hypothetical protein
MGLKGKGQHGPSASMNCISALMAVSLRKISSSVTSSPVSMLMQYLPYY